jgi:tRNA A37 threonylcarbamoyladenosine synthetase subunit TsaC/SUA5/YrdC
MDSNLVYLVQTDTTVGFSSSDDEKLTLLKQRPKSQKTLQTVNSFKTLKKNTRIPKKFRKKVRNSKRTTFIYPNGKSFRVISSNDKFYTFINKFEALYSTSANLTGNSFQSDFAHENSDIIVYTKEEFSENISSIIYKINKKKIVKIR